MKRYFLMVALMTAMPALSGCGVKGKLQSPSEIQFEKEKEQKKKEKDARNKKDNVSQNTSSEDVK